MMAMIAKVFLLFLATASSFTVTTLHSKSSSHLSLSSSNGEEIIGTEISNGRRDFLFSSLSTTLSIALLQPQQANADVSDGNSLPQGAAQFSRILKAKNDLITVIARVKDHASEIDSKEWENISTFLRKIYSAGDDMKVTAKTLSEDKKKSADEIIKTLQKLAIAGDIPAQKNDAEGFLVVTNKLTKLFDDFFDLLYDVPDEI